MYFCYIKYNYYIGTAEDSIQRTEMYLKQKLKGGAASIDEDFHLKPLYRPASSKNIDNDDMSRLSFNEDLDEEFHLRTPHLSYRPVTSKNEAEIEYGSPNHIRSQSSDEFLKPQLPSIKTRQYSANSADQDKQSNFAEGRQNMSRIRNSNSKSDNNIIKSSKGRAGQ